MSVLKNLKSIFVIEDEKGAKNKEAAKPKTSKKNEGKRNDKDTGKTVRSVVESSGEVDQRIVNTLFKAIERSNIQGFDYLEFKQSVKGLEKMVTDEATRFKSAFATASTIGVTMDKLVKSATHYAGILDKEKSQFIQAANDQSNNLIEKRKVELQDLLKSLEEKKKAIERMQEDLLKGEKKIKVIQDGIKNSTVKIENTKRNFEASWTFLKDQIISDINKMKTYLK